MDYWLGKLERDVAHELKQEGCQRNEMIARMSERVYSLSSPRLADEINRRYGKNSVSATSIRRRHRLPESASCDSGTPKACGPYMSKLFADWESHRRAVKPLSELVDGSFDRQFEEVKGDERLRNLMDGTLATATIQDAAEEEVISGNLFPHEGGEGVVRPRPAKNDTEVQQDREDRAADDFLRDAGLNPHALHRPVEGRRKRRAD